MVKNLETWYTNKTSYWKLQLDRTKNKGIGIIWIWFRFERLVNSNTLTDWQTKGQDKFAGDKTIWLDGDTCLRLESNLNWRRLVYIIWQKLLRDAVFILLVFVGSKNERNLYNFVSKFFFCWESVLFDTVIYLLAIFVYRFC